MSCQAALASDTSLYTCPWLPFSRSSEKILRPNQPLSPLSVVSQAVVTAPLLAVSDLLGETNQSWKRTCSFKGSQWAFAHYRLAWYVLVIWTGEGKIPWACCPGFMSLFGDGWRLAVPSSVPHPGRARCLWVSCCITSVCIMVMVCGIIGLIHVDSSAAQMSIRSALGRRLGHYFSPFVLSV